MFHRNGMFHREWYCMEEAYEDAMSQEMEDETSRITLFYGIEMDRSEYDQFISKKIQEGENAHPAPRDEFCPLCGGMFVGEIIKESDGARLVSNKTLVWHDGDLLNVCLHCSINQNNERINK